MLDVSKIRGFFMRNLMKGRENMRRILRNLLLLTLAAALLGCLFLGANASSFESSEDALGYLDSYSDNVASDPDFGEKVDSAISTVREDVGSYATFLALLPPIIAIALALITKEVYSS